jgi:hypothetical protein
MKCKLNKWNHTRPEKRIREWVLAFVSTNNKTIPITTKDILALYELGTFIYQWTIIDFDNG